MQLVTGCTALLDLTSRLGCQEDAISVSKLLVQVSGGVASPSYAGDFQHSTAPQLMQHQAGIILCCHLRSVGLHTSHKVQFSPAHATGHTPALMCYYSLG